MLNSPFILASFSEIQQSETFEPFIFFEKAKEKSFRINEMVYRLRNTDCLLGKIKKFYMRIIKRRPINVYKHL